MEIEREIEKLERRIFKIQCKLEAINDELFHLELIKQNKLNWNKKQRYRKEHLEKVINHYNEEIELLRYEIYKLKSGK